MQPFAFPKIGAIKNAQHRRLDMKISIGTLQSLNAEDSVFNLVQ